MRLPPLIRQAMRQLQAAAPTAPDPGPDTPEDLAVLMRALQPAPRPLSALPSPKRLWRPAAAAPGIAARVILRHPALASLKGVPDAPLAKVGRSPRSSSRGEQGRFPSMKAGRSMRRAARLEAAAMLLCELCGEVTYVCEQPLTLEYSTQGARLRYRPDLLRIADGGIELIEVRPEKLAAKPEEEARWPMIGAAVAAMGLTFMVMTEREIKAEPRWGQLNAVWRDRMAAVPGPGPTGEILGLLRERGSMPIDRLLGGFPALQARALHAMIRRGTLLARFGLAAIEVRAPLHGQVFPKRKGAV